MAYVLPSGALIPAVGAHCASMARPRPDAVLRTSSAAIRVRRPPRLRCQSAAALGHTLQRRSSAVPGIRPTSSSSGAIRYASSGQSCRDVRLTHH